MAFLGVAQVGVLDDDHVSIADFFEGAKAQMFDAQLGDSHTAAATKVPKGKGGTGKDGEKAEKKGTISCLPFITLQLKRKHRRSQKGTYRLVLPRMISRFSKGLSESMLSGHV